MEDNRPRNTEYFEDMKVFFKALSIHGIILSLLFMALGIVGCYLLITGITLPSVFGVASIALGTLFLIYNLILLSSVGENQAARVSQIIKVGCLICLYLQLITKFLGTLTLLAHRSDSPLAAGVVTGVSALGMFLTALTIYAIHSAKPKIVSLYISIVFVFFGITISLIISSEVIIFLMAFIGVDVGGFFVAFLGKDLGGFFAAFNCAGILYAQSIGIPVPVLIIISITCFFIVIILVYSIMSYYLKMFALHHKMMTIAPITNNLDHHQQLINL